MEERLNILCQSSDYYAPFAGVMLTSLFENNKDMKQITVYLMTADMSEKNRGRFILLAKQYQREIKFLDTVKIDQILKSNCVPKYRNSYATYYKIFALSIIEDDIDRLIYLDSDMLVEGQLSELISWKLGDNALGMCIEAAPVKYRKIIQCDSETYYNAGMILFDVKKWIKRNSMKKVIDHITNIHSSYPFADQDLLNIVFRGCISTIPQKYNVNSGILIYKDYRWWKESYGIQDYYSEKEFNLAKEHPIVLHCMATFGMRPWFIGNHPAQNVWVNYMKSSPWNDFAMISNKCSIVNGIQLFLFKNISKRLFAFINRNCFYLTWRREARRLGILK